VSYLNGASANTEIFTSICTTGNRELPPTKLIVYPNPSTGIISVESDKNVGVIKVFDALGRLILNQNATELHTDLDLTGVADGLYIVRIGNQSFKIVKK
jgi:Secretion system C-terminal sorting domain